MTRPVRFSTASASQDGLSLRRIAARQTSEALPPRAGGGRRPAASGRSLPAAPRRHAFTLVEVLGMLPVIMALMLAAYALASRMERLQGQEGVRRLDDTRIRDVVRRIQEDAGHAANATLETSQNGRQLTLRLPEGSVTYTATPTGITRTELSAAALSARYTWPLALTRFDFQIEAIAGRPRLLWIHCDTRLTFDAGPDDQRRVSIAATIDRGGAR